MLPSESFAAYKSKGGLWFQYAAVSCLNGGSHRSAPSYHTRWNKALEAICDLHDATCDLPKQYTDVTFTSDGMTVIAQCTAVPEKLPAGLHFTGYLGQTYSSLSEAQASFARGCPMTWDPAPASFDAWSGTVVGRYDEVLNRPECPSNSVVYANWMHTCPTYYRGDGNVPPLCVSIRDGGYFAQLVTPVKNKNVGCGHDNETSMGCLTGNPVHVGIGNKFQEEVDYVSGAGSLSFIRYFNSDIEADQDGALGGGWRHSYSRSIATNQISGIQTASVSRPDGKVFFFTLEGGKWMPDSDVSTGLVQSATGWWYTTGGDEVESYDASGNLLSISDRSGYVRTLAYDDKQRLSSVTDTFGRRLTFTYDDTDRIMAFTDPGGGVYTYRYGANNTLVSVIYPDGKVRSYLYENTRYPRALTGISDENSNRYATWSYDAQGRAVSSEHAGGADRVTLTYNTDGVTTNVTDALGATQLYTYANILGTVRLTGKTRSCAGCVPSSMSYTHDPNGNIASKTDFNGVTTTYTHDLTRNLELSRTEAYGTPQARTITTEWHPVFRLPTKITEPNRITTFTYDAQGNLLQKTLASGTQSRTWTYTYNSLGQVLTADGPRTDVADVTTYSYDNQGNLATVTNALGHVTRLTAHDAHGRPLTLQDPNGLVTQVAYDSRGRLISRTVGGEVTAYQYDGVGQLIKVTLPDASVVNYTYDAAHRLTTISDTLGNRIAYTLDPMGNRIKEEVCDPNGVLTQTRSRVYDALNRLAQHLGAQNQSTAYQYDANGNLTATTNPLSYTNTNSYDALNRLIQVTDPAGGITRYAYDASDRITQVTDPRGIGTAYTYDGLDSLTQTVSLDAGTTTNTYDANGNLTAQTDARNRKTTYTYDTLNRLTSTTFADGTAIAWQYDTGVNGLGRLTKMTDPSGNTQWTYSPQGRVLSKTQLTGTVSQNLSYAYDSAGRLSQITYPSVRHVGYSYDAAGRISSITLNGQPLLSNIQYQPHGPAKSWTLGNGTAYQRVFDADGRLTSHPQGSLSYDAASRPVLQQTPSGTHSYGYDAVDRLTGYAAPAGMTSSYQYDTNGNRTRLTQGGAVTDYAIPVTSNRLIGQSGTTPKNYTMTPPATSLPTAHTPTPTTPVAGYPGSATARAATPTPSTASASAS